MITNIRNDRGAVALITSIIISLLLSIVLTGFIVVMVSELRQSNDAEQSMHAYFAAQSGVEEAIHKVLTQPHVDQPCGPARPLSKKLDLDPAAPGQVGWSCQAITFSGQPSGTLPTPDKSTQFDLTGAPAYTKATLQWETSASNSNYTTPPVNLPTAGGWSSRPAAVELTIVSYPRIGTFNAAAISTQNYLILPGNTGPGSGSINGGPGTNPLHGRCVAAGTYHCSIDLANFSPSKSYVLRIRTRYIGTDYQFTFRNGASVVAVPDGNATIDVTGKSGDVFRRVIYKVPLNKGVAQGLDYVLYSDTDVCKDLTIIGGVVQPGSACP